VLTIKKQTSRRIRNNRENCRKKYIAPWRLHGITDSVPRISAYAPHSAPGAHFAP